VLRQALKDEIAAITRVQVHALCTMHFSQSCRKPNMQRVNAHVFQPESSFEGCLWTFGAMPPVLVGLENLVGRKALVKIASSAGDFPGSFDSLFC
jgi:hypothetical protein